MQENYAQPCAFHVGWLARWMLQQCCYIIVKIHNTRRAEADARVCLQVRDTCVITNPTHWLLFDG